MGGAEFTNGGNRWVALEKPPIDEPAYLLQAMALAISPDYAADSTLFWSLYGMGRDVVLKSTDGGQSWEEALGRTAQLLAVSPDYTQDRTIYAVLSGAGLMRSTGGTLCHGGAGQRASRCFHRPLALS